MIDRLKGLWFRFNRSILAWLSEPKALGFESLPTDQPMCYVLKQRSLSDLAMLDIVARTHTLPLPRENLEEPSLAGYQRFFYLSHATGRLGRKQLTRHHSRRLLRLEQQVRDGRETNVLLVPVSVFWSRAPNKERSLIRLLLSENWAVTSRLRRLVVILLNRREITVQFGTPVGLLDAAEPTMSDARLARRVARLMRVQFKAQRTALLGPDLSHRRTLANQILQSALVREALANVVAEGTLTPEKGRRLARKHVNAIASDVTYVTIQFFNRLLTWFWNRIYDGTEVHGLDRLHTLAETSTLIYIPSHRSHIDYLLGSYVLYHHGFVVPHIAAGDNLNMPVVGALLRRAGAFFMRRSFQDDPLYSAVFSEYFFQVLRRGSPVMYFIEGGRTRSGRLLQPRTGMLNMTIDSHHRGLPKPVVFLPVYFGYEKLIEGGSYLDELRGAEKQKESLADVAGNLRLLKQRFGRVAVNFGQPVILGEYWREHEHLGPRKLARQLARDLLCRVNAAAAVTPINLVALVTLSMPRVAIDERQLIDQVDVFRDLLAREHDHTDTTITDLSGREVVEYAEQLGMLVREHHGFGDVLGHDPSSAVMMTWYRNNVLHTLALPSLIACLVANRRRRVGAAQLRTMVETVYPYLELELHIARSEPLSALIDRWLGHLTNAGLLRRYDEDGGAYKAPDPNSIDNQRLHLLAQVIMQTLERFYIVIALLIQAGPNAVTRDTLERQCERVAERMSRLYGLNAPEFFDARLLNGFVDSLLTEGVVTRHEDDTLSFEPIVIEVFRAAARVISAEFRHAVLREPNAN
jgi:glycerol-3-phosphate O-acyltransferase